MAKDSKGHGSDAHGAARREIQGSPDAQHAQAEATLRSFGYKTEDLNRLRVLAGANVGGTNNKSSMPPVASGRAMPLSGLAKRLDPVALKETIKKAAA